jgi:hypothetical protein
VVPGTRVVTTAALPGCPTVPGRYSLSRAQRRPMARPRPLQLTCRLLPPLFRLLPARLRPPAAPGPGLFRARVGLVRSPRCRASVPLPPRRPLVLRPRRPRLPRRPPPPRRPPRPRPRVRPPPAGPPQARGRPLLVRPERASQARVRPARARAPRAQAVRKARKARRGRTPRKAAGKAGPAGKARVRQARHARVHRAPAAIAPLVPGSAVRGLVRGQVTTRSVPRRPAWAPRRLPALASAASAPSALTAPTGAIVVRVPAWVAVPAPARVVPVIAVLAGLALQPAAALPGTVAPVPVARVLAVRGPAR